MSSVPRTAFCGHCYLLPGLALVNDEYDDQYCNNYCQDVHCGHKCIQLSTVSYGAFNKPGMALCMQVYKAIGTEEYSTCIRKEFKLKNLKDFTQGHKYNRLHWRNKAQHHLSMVLKR